MSSTAAPSRRYDFSVEKGLPVKMERRSTMKTVRELAGTWRGWVTAEPGQMRVGGQYYIQDGKVRYRSSRSSGTATVSEEKGKTILTIVPEGIPIRTGRTQYERVK
jgi:hypothetical protein